MSCLHFGGKHFFSSVAFFNLLYCVMMSDIDDIYVAAFTKIR